MFHRIRICSFQKRYDMWWECLFDAVQVVEQREQAQHKHGVYVINLRLIGHNANLTGMLITGFTTGIS